MGAIGGWLATQGASLLLGWLTQTLLAYAKQRQQDQNARDLATTKARLDQATATIDAQQAELQAAADAPSSVDEAIKRLREGSA